MSSSCLEYKMTWEYSLHKLYSSFIYLNHDFDYFGDIDSYDDIEDVENFDFDYCNEVFEMLQEESKVFELYLAYHLEVEEGKMVDLA